MLRSELGMQLVAGRACGSLGGELVINQYAGKIYQ